VSDKSLLFVDDDPAILSAMRRLFADMPYEVRTCENPVAALDEVRARPPTVVVADYYMPPMIGPAFLQEVRRIAPLAVRMILTGKPDLVAVLAAVQDGAVYRFLLKPWDNDDLRMSVQQAFDHSHLVAERDALLVELQRRRNGS